MSDIFFRPEDIFNGITLILNDFSEKKVEINSVEYRKTDVPDYFHNVKFIFSYNSVDYQIDTLMIFPDKENIYHFKDKEYYSPYVLFEKKERIQKQSEKGFKNSMDLEDFWIIPGYFLQRTMMMMNFMRSIDSIKEKIDEDKKIVLQEHLSANLSRVIAGASSSFPWYKTDKQKIIKKGKIEKKIKKYRYITPPGIFPLDDENKLLKVSNLRKIVYHSELGESMRYQHHSQVGKIDLLETPESGKIGLSLYITKNATFVPGELKILSQKEYDCSYSTLFVPYKSYSDSTRTMMGGKNLKQAVKVNKCEPPLVNTGIEKEIDFFPGVNAFVGYALYNGLNFEDGIVVSDSFTKKMEIKKTEKFILEDSIPLPDFYSIEHTQNGFTIYDSELFDFQKKEYKDKAIKIDYSFSKKALYYNDIIMKRNVKKYDLQGKKWQQLNNEEVTDWAKREKEFKSKKTLALKSFPYKERYSGEIINCPDDIKIIEKKPFQKKNYMLSKIELEFSITICKPLETGDKITGRHGNKGTVSAIIPKKEMPYIIEGGEKKHLEMILNPLGIITRMNLGQLLETQGSLAGICDGDGFKKFNFEKLLRFYYTCDIDRPMGERLGRIYLYFNEGYRFPATVGYQYFIRLNHCVRDKLHVIGKTNNISKFSSQPLKGKKNNGGQRFGEMEFWSLFDYNALNTIDRFSKTNLRKWDNKDYMETYKKILKYKLIEVNHNNFPKTIISKTSIDNTKEFEDIYIKYKPFLYKKTLFSKDGFFRKNMLGRRLNYSGRATISPAVDIDINHVKLPIEFAIMWSDELNLDFLKHIDNRLIYSENSEKNKFNRKKISEKINSEIEKREKELFVLLNRQPSLHLHSIQSFIPIFSPDYSISLPIMVCEGFGADFDGDTMAVYYPIDQNKKEVREELKSMLPFHNPFKIGNGDLIFSTGQDITYGHYILTDKKKKGAQESLRNLIDQCSSNELPKRVLEWQTERLKTATKNGLSLSIFEIKNNCGYFKDIHDSGARGKTENFEQLQKSVSFGPDNKIDESFSMGISINNYFGNKEHFYDKNIASRGRKSLMDKKLHVAQAGYLTRKLVEFLYAERISEEDCGTEDGLFFDSQTICNLARNKYALEKLVKGRYYKFNKNDEWKLCEDFSELKSKAFWLRSPVKCKAEKGYCSKCCGEKLSSGLNYKIGEFIGVISGHSIGERGTQLSMKTFQTGESGFNMQRVSKIFFQRIEEKNETDDYIQYLLNLSYTDIQELMVNGNRYILEGKNKKNPEKPLLDTIDISSIYFEILFSSLVKRKVNNETEAKKYLMDFEKNGFFSSISFQSNIKGINELKKESEIKETVFFEKSPKAIYSLKPGEVIKYANEIE